MKRRTKSLSLEFLFFLLFLPGPGWSQQDVMMQGFYWDVPVDAVARNGTWWDNLASKAPAWADAGITAVWVPPPSKGNVGIYDMGYGVYDHYDLGNYSQKGTQETRFGSRKELEEMLLAMHDQGIAVYADVVLNHIFSGDEDMEANPAVKGYVFDEAYRDGVQRVPYPTDEIRWVIPDAEPGDYYVKIKGYHLPFDKPKGERGYDIFVRWNDTSPDDSNPQWEFEPNNGGGQSSEFPGSGRALRGHIESQGDIDEYKITLDSAHDIEIRLTARRENTEPEWSWDRASQTNGYYPVEIWHEGENLAQTSLEARTRTGISYPDHTGAGEKNYSWSFRDFHPVDKKDWLGGDGNQDSIITNTKYFGNDLNTFSAQVQTRLKDWGEWLAEEIGFDGFRLDFVRGVQPEFVADWVKNLPPLNGGQRFIVGEYWSDSHPFRLKGWVDELAAAGADADVFDFPLRSNLKRMCNDADFEMHWLNHAGMVRDLHNSLPGTSVVTFLDNHDTGKESDKWIHRDFHLGYAYILTHEGRPTIFYPHYYGVTQLDQHDHSKSVTTPASLQEDIDKLIFVRKTYLGGSLEVLSQQEVGNPWPARDTKHVYVARRQGNGVKDGAIVAINNHETAAKGLWVNSSPAGFSDWAGETLVDAFDPSRKTVVQADGRVYLEAPQRGWRIWVKEGEREDYPGSH